MSIPLQEPKVAQGFFFDSRVNSAMELPQTLCK